MCVCVGVCMCVCVGVCMCVCVCVAFDVCCIYGSKNFKNPNGAHHT